MLLLQNLDIAPMILLTRNCKAKLCLFAAEMSHMMDQTWDQITTHVKPDKLEIRDFEIRSSRNSYRDVFVVMQGKVPCQWDSARSTSDPFDEHNS